MKTIDLLIKERVLTEANKCLLCYDAPCTKACPNNAEPSKFIKSIHFENEKGAIQNVKESGVSLECVQECENKYCEKACIRGKLDSSVDIKIIHEYLAMKAKEGEE